MLRVVPGSPASKAGLQPGEVVVSADGKPVTRTSDLLALVQAKQLGGLGVACAWSRAM